MDENQTSTSKNHTNNTPFRSNQNEKAKERETIKEKNKLHTQKQKLKNNDLD
jgi:hypothetical protein